jgi:hypothetical protein
MKKAPRNIATARQLEIEANQLDMRAAELATTTLTRDQLVIAWRQAAAATRTQATAIRAELGKPIRRKVAA